MMKGLKLDSASTVLVTGASGFVGSALIDHLAREQVHRVRAVVRNEARDVLPSVERVVVSSLAADTNWLAALANVDLVVHLAGRVHVMRNTSTQPLEEFRRVNVDGTLNLARQAAQHGVSRFVFVSSIKVNGESGRYSEADPPTPVDPYGISKHEAEVGLFRVAAESGMEVVIIRPPLVYGPGVKANFHALMRAVDRGIPLPFGAIQNQRSLIALGNLVDFIDKCIDEPAAANETFLVSDGEDISTTDLIRRIACSMERPARLIPVPERLLMYLAVLAGKRSVAQRLLGSLQLDIRKARETLGWTPPLTVDEGLKLATAGYR
jgi:UDP-glucose 4-epimerase